MGGKMPRDKLLREQAEEDEFYSKIEDEEVEFLAATADAAGRHKRDWSIQEKESIRKIDTYRNSFGELLTSPNPNILWSWTNPDGKKTPKSNDIWASDSGFFFSSESAQKTSKRHASPDELASSEVLIRGNMSLRSDVKKCGICQRDSYYLYPKYKYDEKGFLTDQLTEIEKVCKTCLHKRILKSHRRDVKVGGRGAAHRGKPLKQMGYKWNIVGIHKSIKPFERTPLTSKDAKLYRDAYETTLMQGRKGGIHPTRGMIESVDDYSPRVSKFLKGIFDFTQ